MFLLALYMEGLVSYVDPERCRARVLRGSGESNDQYQKTIL